jgi:hypothetical protein
MLEDWKRAWREAVANFHHELRGSEDDVDGAHSRALRREVATARGALASLDREIRDTRRQLDEERRAAADCARREALARDIGDDETVRLAVEFGQRHAERAEVLSRKVDVLEAERELMARDVTRMQELAGADPGPSRGAIAEDEDARTRTDAELRDLGRRDRERAAAERLEELKRRMGQ